MAKLSLRSRYCARCDFFIHLTDIIKTCFVYSHRRYYSPDTMCFIPTSDNAKEAGLRNQAMKIAKSDYYSINKNRESIVDEAKEALIIDYEIVMNGNTHTIITDTPYGTTIFFPLTKKIMRHCSIIDGDVHVFIQYCH